MPLAARVLRTIQRLSLVPPGGRVIVALSGGPDSVALVHLLRELERGGHLILAAVAHFNHQLRGAAADGDEQFCRALASTLEVPIEVGRADVREIARREKRSIEDAARRLRYAFLREAAGRLEADAVAVGHSREDQAETFLLRLLRGSGTRGLGSIRPKAGIVIRPLIEVPRAELRQFVAVNRLTYREDETNFDLGVPRNRVRHELLPYLEREFSPNIVEVLAREAALARDDEERLEAEAIELAGSIVLSNTPGHSSASSDRPIDSSADRSVVVDAAGLISLQPALASRVARVALGRLAGDRFIGFDEVRRLLEFARSARQGSALSLPGQQAVREGNWILLGPEPPRSVERQANSFRIPLSIPGEAVLDRQRLVVTAQWSRESDGSAGSGALGTSGVAAVVAGVTGPLAVRSRKPGDTFQPPGLGGRTKKLQDYLVDRKVARLDRDLLPLVVDRDDRIVWIVGHAVAHGFRAAEPSPGVILLKAKYLGGEV